MNKGNVGKIAFKNHIFILGFGSIGKALLPMIFQKLDVQASQVTIIDQDSAVADIAAKFNVLFDQQTINSANFLKIIGSKLSENDFLVDVSYNISSTALIELCNLKGALYINTSTEPWYEEWHVEKPTPALHTNYFLREQVLQLKGKTKKTAVVTHGANPGLISHFVKQALLNIAKDCNLDIPVPKTQPEWAKLSSQLGIKAIHIAERDTQITQTPKAPDEFVNTWSIYGFRDESVMPSELGWGTHERHWPRDGQSHTIGSQCAIYLMHPGANVRARSWTPSLGAYQGRIISHAESTSLADYLTAKDQSKIVYRPTVHYVYDPCPDAERSIMELANNEWQLHNQVRLIVNDITKGVDELGVLLMGHEKGAYWFGSTLSIEEARALVPQNNATSLQVVAGVMSAMMWAIEHPNEGIVEPEDIDHQYIMNIAVPYLGKVSGHYTNWTPLDNRQVLFSEELDLSDPWQFINIRVD